MRNKSFQIDKELYKRNIATFKNRLSVVPNFSLEKIKKERLNHFQQEALERWLLYVEIFQDENKVITETLKKYPTLQKEFVQQTKDYSFYLNLPINKIRREKKIEPFIFSLGFILNGLV